jgi:hypothetical protein
VLKELKADPSVQYAEADVKLRRTELRAGNVQPALVPNDPFYQQNQWHCTMRSAASTHRRHGMSRRARASWWR